MITDDATATPPFTFCCAIFSLFMLQNRYPGLYVMCILTYSNAHPVFDFVYNHNHLQHYSTIPPME